MNDQNDVPARGLRGWTAKVNKGEAENLLKRVTEIARETASEVLVLRGDLVFGLDHMRSALQHARKAIDEGRNSSDSLTMETLLYSSGERQLGNAISKMSVNKQTENVAVVLLSGNRFEADKDWVEIPSVPPIVHAADLKRFGISDAELRTVPKDKAVELVLERVAAIDISKR